MSVLPKKPLERIQFLENHLATWSTNATAIGSSAAEITALTTKVSAARAGFDDQQLARDAAQTATLNYQLLVRTMRDAASDLIKKVKSKAATDGDNVYVLAAIPAPATPSPVGPPGTPSNFTVELAQNGAITLKWKCVNPVGAAGTIYQVSRRIGASGEFGFVGASGRKKFVDATLPAGSGPVTYQITAQRSTSSGEPAQFTVSFGVGGGGEMTASIASTPTPRMAA
jgi:hypothetical protein